MRKLLPVVLTGLLAVSFSQLAAAQSTTVQGSTGADASADVKSKPADTTVGGSAGAQTGASEVARLDGGRPRLRRFQGHSLQCQLLPSD